MMPQRKTPTPPPRREAPTTVVFEQVLESVYGHRAIIYGPGGVGKSTLACQAPGLTAFVDADESLEKLRPQLLESGIKVPVKIKVNDWTTLRAALQSGGYEKIKNIVLDTWAPLEKWCIDSVLATVRTDKGHVANSVEDYGYGKGYRYVFEAFLPLLGDLDKHVRAGRNVIMICHDDTAKVPNPAGQDFMRWEPKMQNTPNASLRYRMKEWCDHCLFLAYDMVVDKQAGDVQGKKAGKATGCGTRALHTAELPHFMAKSRTTSESIDVKKGEPFPWENIFK
jgi:hypothetical protein